MCGSSTALSKNCKKLLPVFSWGTQQPLQPVWVPSSIWNDTASPSPSSRDRHQSAALRLRHICWTIEGSSGLFCACNAIGIWKCSTSAWGNDLIQILSMTLSRLKMTSLGLSGKKSNLNSVWKKNTLPLAQADNGRDPSKWSGRKREASTR